MSIRAALRKLILDDQFLRDKLGQDRVHLNQAAPKGLFPRIVYQAISTDHTHHMTGPSGLVSALYQFSIMVVNDSETGYAIADAVRQVLDKFSGDVTGLPGGVVAIDEIHIENQLDDFEPPSDNSENVIHIIRQDYSVWYREPIPA